MGFHPLMFEQAIGSNAKIALPSDTIRQGD